MKNAIIFVFVASFAASALAQTKNPREIYDGLVQTQRKMYEKTVENSADRDAASKKVQDQVRHMVLDALKGVSPKNVDPKDAYDWAKLYNWVHDRQAVVELTRLYLTSNPDPEKKFKDQFLLIQSYSALGEVDLLKQAVLSAEPVTAMEKVRFYYAATAYAKQIAGKEGNPEGLRFLDSFQQHVDLASPRELARESLSEEKTDGHPGAPPSPQVPVLTDDQKLAQYEAQAIEENRSARGAFATARAALLKAEGKTTESLAVLRNFSKNARSDDPTMIAFGDTAPAFTVGKWLKGQPIEKLERGKVYVLDFWGTKCGPCIAAFPHLKEMAKKYKGKAEFIGVCVVRWSPTIPYPDTPELRVDFVKNRRSEMVDRVVEDRLDGAMVTNWLDRTGETSIPRLFVVDDQGKIVWFGQPELLSVALDNCLSKSKAQTAVRSADGTR